MLTPLPFSSPLLLSLRSAWSVEHMRSFYFRTKPQQIPEKQNENSKMRFSWTLWTPTSIRWGIVTTKMPKITKNAPFKKFQTKIWPTIKTSIKCYSLRKHLWTDNSSVEGLFSPLFARDYIYIDDVMDKMPRNFIKNRMMSCSVEWYWWWWLC